MVAHLRSMGDDLSVSINDQLRSLMRKGTGIDAKKSLFSFGGLAGIAGQAARLRDPGVLEAWDGVVRFESK